MKFWSLAVAVGGIAYCVSQGADARSISGQGAPYSAKQMPLHGQVDAPIGFIRFCQQHPEDCVSQGSRDAEVILTTSKWKELQKINRKVNLAIKPISDQAQYGTIEKWTYPVSGKGDCEDYVLLKIRKLMERGWPQGVLLITVVRDEHGEGHAVLTVRTSRGDLILDNKHSRIVAWRQTPYQFIKRQSSADPRLWDSLVPMHEGPTVAASGADRE